MQKTEQGRRLGSQTPVMDGFSPVDDFRPWEVGLRWGAGPGAGEVGARPAPAERVPAAARGSAAGARPRGSQRRIVSFQSENLQALGNDIQKSI